MKNFTSSSALFALAMAIAADPAGGQTIFVPGGAIGSSSNGNVGIGTSSPAAKLDVLGDLRVDASSGRPITLGGNSGSIYLQADSGGWALGLHARGSLGADKGGFGFYGSGDSLSYYYIGQDYASPSMVVSGDGRVGIGRTNPGMKLSVNGALGIGPDELRIQSTYFGYSTSYKVLQIGEESSNRTVALNVDPTTVPGGNFAGHGQLLIGNRGILAPNSNRTDWIGVIRAADDRVFVGGPTSGGDLYGGGITVVCQSGNVGFGMTTPAARLEVAGPANGFPALSGSVQSGASMRIGNSQTNGILDVGVNSGIGAWFQYSHRNDLSQGFPILLNPNGGNVGIGTINPTHKLSVNGTIRSKEIVVETVGWSDYVFADDYDLKPLTEVEQHIKQHKHLPGIPSAAEIAEKGVGVGEMQAKLLAKIEELTLHQIHQQKLIARLMEQNESLQTRLRQIERRD